MTMMDATALIGRAQDAYGLGAQQRATADASRAGQLDPKKAKEAAENFESFFLSQALEQMWQGVEVDPMFGGGHAEEMWRSMLNQEYGKHIVKSGGLGIANQVMNEMLKAQEARTMADQKLATLTSAEPSQDGVATTAGAVAAAATARR
ncbi:MAG: rod-binding protein [Rhodospirillaceae bacterium]|nr:rod-binding protein [Rhodospirillaceae bacterium]